LPRTLARLALGLAGLALPLSAQTAPTGEGADTDWEAWTHSEAFQAYGLRCGMPPRELQPIPVARGGASSDCSLTLTNPTANYDPGVLYDIPVVVHVLMNTSGTGDITPAMVQSQIGVLNQDFRALPGTPGAPGVDTGIRFHLATEDPLGNPTTGITYTTNNSWFNDSGDYWTPLNWDPSRYLNIYTNTASGALGYVPALPQSGIVGNANDRVVILWSSFGFNAPIGPPYNKGRTTTHEVGHYLGLDHTFSGGCAPAGSCYTNGDLICDTNPEQTPFFGCGNRTTCGTPDPTSNYLDYTDDQCMNRFTTEQARRMRCTLEHWRFDLPDQISAAAVTRNGTGVNPNDFVPVNLPSAGSSWQSTMNLGGLAFSLVAISDRGPTTINTGLGQILIIPPIVAPLNAAFGSHSIFIPNNPNLIGRTFYTQGITYGPGVVFHNAIDITIGF